MCLVELINELLKMDKDINTLAKELYKHKSLLVMGRGYNFATCLEGALVSLLDSQIAAIIKQAHLKTFRKYS